MIYLMRHGQDDENFIGGWSDVELLEVGKEEVKNVGLWIKNNLEIKKIISSSVYRAIQTAKIVNQYLGVPLLFDDNLREQSKGVLNGMKKEVAQVKYGELLKNVDIYTVYPQGESLVELYERIKAYLSRIYEVGDDTLVITHRGVINMIYYILYGVDLDMQKGRFGVETASVHELDLRLNKISRVK